MDAELLRGYIEQGFGGESIPTAYGVEGAYRVHVIEGNEKPYPGFNSYSTFGLSKYELNGVKGKMPFRVELISGSVSTVYNYAKILVAAADYFIQTKTCYGPGSLIQSGTTRAQIGYPQMPHMYITIPAYWQHNFGGVKLSSYEVKFLCVFPISEKELRYCEKYGSDKFETLLEESEADVFNISRLSVI
jgi:hypothetical protein